MPNWNINEVEINAPIDQVRNYFTQSDDKLFFNMHMIFPERFSVDDELGMKNWDYYWMCEHT
jgi:hypothetical protein